MIGDNIPHSNIVGLVGDMIGDNIPHSNTTHSDDAVRQARLRPYDDRRHMVKSKKAKIRMLDG